jgi:hypothetical protein
MTDEPQHEPQQPQTPPQGEPEHRHLEESGKAFVAAPEELMLKPLPDSQPLGGMDPAVEPIMAAPVPAEPPVAPPAGSSSSD